MSRDARALERARRRRILRTRLWLRRHRPDEVSIGGERIPIGPLVSPLRIDVLVRLDYLRWCRDHFDLAERDQAGFVSASLDRPYAIWFREIWCRGHNPRALTSPIAFRRAFARRCFASLRLLRGFLDRGLDVGRPLVVKRARRVLPTRSGKRVAAHYFPGDGCHRLALLLLAGQADLMPGRYLVDSYESLAPLDHTARLLPCLALDEGDYARFLSLGYASQRFDRWQVLADWVAAHDPARAAELADVRSRDMAGPAPGPSARKLPLSALVPWPGAAEAEGRGA